MRRIVAGRCIDRDGRTWRRADVARPQPGGGEVAACRKSAHERAHHECEQDASSAQGYVDDPRNDRVLVYVNGEFVPRDQASVSVFDAGFVLGDGVWEGLRLVRGRLVELDAHMDRLYEGAAAIALDIGMPREALVAAVEATLQRNGMADGAHVRLMVTRGRKKTPNQDPRFALGRATIVIVAEYKTPLPEAKARGLALFTSTFRCSGPDVFDLRLNSHSRLNLIQALIQAIEAGADEALMLDPHGFVASCNSTNFFVVRGGEVWTSTGRYNFKGITRRKVLALRAPEWMRRASSTSRSPSLSGARGVRDRHAGRHHAGHADRRPRRSATADGPGHMHGLRIGTWRRPMRNEQRDEKARRHRTLRSSTRLQRAGPLGATSRSRRRWGSQPDARGAEARARTRGQPASSPVIHDESSTADTGSDLGGGPFVRSSCSVSKSRSIARPTTQFENPVSATRSSASPQVQECHMVAGGLRTICSAQGPRAPDMAVGTAAFSARCCRKCRAIREPPSYAVMENVKESLERSTLAQSEIGRTRLRGRRIADCRAKQTSSLIPAREPQLISFVARPGSSTSEWG
jgi:branched-chain amino acid aminotransferase